MKRYSLQPRAFELESHSDEVVEYTDYVCAGEVRLPKECPRYEIKPFDGEAPVSGALRNMDYPFIAIAHCSILIRSGGCWILGHINFCRLFNAKSIFMQIVLFRTIQFSMSTQFNCQKTFLFQFQCQKEFRLKQLSLA